MALELRSLGSFAPITGSMADRFVARSSAAPRLSSSVLATAQDHFAAQVATMTPGTLDPDTLEPTGAPAADAEITAHCQCMLNAIPGIAENEANMRAGLELCLRDPATFASQVAAAGWVTNCDGASGGAPTLRSGSFAAFISTTPGKIAIGAGVLGVLLGGAYLVLR